MKKRVLLGAILNAVISCGDVATKHASFFSHLQNVPGEDSSMAILPGQGFNHINWTPKGHCVKIADMQTQSGQSTGQFVEYRLLEVTSLSSLRENLNITASASFRASIFGRVSARINYAKSVNKNSSSRYLLVHTRVGNQLQLASDFSFSDDAQALLKEADNKTFIDHCGTEFVYGYRTGGEFFALFEFEFSSRDEDRKFSAALDASGLQWKASADINNELRRFNLNARVHLSMYRIGGTGPLPTIENLEDFARNYPTLVESTSNNFVTLELITKDYTGVKPLNLSPNAGLLIRQDRVINRLAKNREHAKEALNTIRYIKLHPHDFHFEPDGVDLDAKENKLLSYINQQNDAAVNCFADILNGCQLPEIPFPALNFPERKWEETSPGRFSCQANAFWSKKDQKCCHYEIASVCVMRNHTSECQAYENRRNKVCEPTL